MDLSIVRMVLLFIAAGLAAFVVFRLARGVRIEKSSTRRMQDFAESRQLSAMDRYGESLADRFGLSLTAWKNHLRWARLGGHYVGYTAGGIIARSIVYAVAAIAYITVFHGALFMWLGVALAAYYPFMRVKSRADDTRKEVSRLLPEVATVIAAEMDAGSGPESALSRASEMPGPIGTLLQEAIAASRQSSRPMFTRGAAQGVVLEMLSREGQPGLLRFASQLDRVAAKGVDGPRVMIEIARGFAREYKGQVTRAAANLDSQLLFPMAIFFFVPFMAALMLPLFISLFKAF